jgi:hypothetical protein
MLSWFTSKFSGNREREDAHSEGQLGAAASSFAPSPSVSLRSSSASSSASVQIVEMPSPRRTRSGAAQKRAVNVSREDHGSVGSKPGLLPTRCTAAATKKRARSEGSHEDPEKVLNERLAVTVCTLTGVDISKISLDKHRFRLAFLFSFLSPLCWPLELTRR